MVKYQNVWINNLTSTIVFEGITHLAGIIERAPFANLNPFPYILFEPALSIDLLKEVHKNFPIKEDLKPIDETGRVRSGYYKERLVLPLDEASISRLPQDKLAFWNSFRQACVKSNLMKCILQKLSPWTHSRILSAQAKHGRIAFALDILAIEDLENYEIPPHTDHPMKLFSLLIYLPRSASQSTLGTRFYKPKQVDFTCTRGGHYSFNDFMEFGRAEFLPNHGLLFPRTDNSFHGVPKINPGNHPRRSLQFNLKVSL